MTRKENYIQEVADDIRARINPDDLPAHGLDNLFSSYALLALSKGPEVTNEDVHDAWSVWATEFDPDNDSLVPFDQLTPKVQAMDSIYRDAINNAARSIEH